MNHQTNLLKTVFVFLLIFCTTLLYSQETLGGLKLGVKNSQSEVVTYFAGIKGKVFNFELNDGRTFQIAFAPTQDGLQITKLKKKAFDDLVNELKRIYNIEFSRVELEESKNDFYYEAYKGNVVYLVDVKYDPDHKFPYDAMVSIVNLELEEIALKEGK